MKLMRWRSIFNKNGQLSLSFLKNGGMLLEELITFCNGRYNIPIRNFSAKELFRATNLFDKHQIILNQAVYKIYKGSLEQRLILVKKFADSWCSPTSPPAILDVVITLQMSSHNNVARLFGCCLEFEGPALVYEYSGNEPLNNLLNNRDGASKPDDRSLKWKIRLRIAKDIANAVVYLHTALSRPVVSRDLHPSNVMVDPRGVAKLFDFSLSVLIPLGESRVKERVVGRFGFLDPEYLNSGFVTEKSDVYSFGVFQLVLLTGQGPFSPDSKEDEAEIVARVKDYVDNDQFTKILDPRILREGGIEQEQQMRAFLALALRCVELKGEDRPEMIVVAKELRKIERSVHP